MNRRTRKIKKNCRQKQTKAEQQEALGEKEQKIAELREALEEKDQKNEQFMAEI